MNNLTQSVNKTSNVGTPNKQRATPGSQHSGERRKLQMKKAGTEQIPTQSKKGKLLGDISDSRPSAIIESEVNHEKSSGIDDSQVEDFKYFINGQQINNLAEYNKKRREMLPLWEVPIPDEEQELNVEDEIEKANTVRVNCFKNIEISLFWEEKIVIIIRVLQLYALFYIYYFESWPSKTRNNLTPVFSTILLSFHIST